MRASDVIPRVLQGFAEVPADREYVLANVNVPVVCLYGVDVTRLAVDHDNLALCDIRISDGKIADIVPPQKIQSCPAVDLEGGCVWPTFVDLHTHIDKAHTCERSRNPTGSLTGADSSTAQDASFWNLGDVFWRMDFSVRCAYAHGTSALRTHLINMNPKQLELTWPAFDKLRAKWKGKVELQGVSLVTLSYFRNRAEATRLADVVAQHRGILGAAVCCSDRGGKPEDDWTTCEADRDELLDFIFTLARERNLLLDFHVDENGNRESRGLRHVAAKTIQHGFQGKVVCGHCCALASQPPDELEATLALAAEAQVTVVSLPLVNEWTQDRCPTARRTPRWRGITTLHELRAAGVPTAMASDNARDQFYAYGDLDMLEVFTQGVRMAQLDRPYTGWPATVTSTPADAMQLREHGRVAVGGPANLVLFRARKYSELLSRPQVDRVLIRDGRRVSAIPPDYKLLDYDATSHEYLYQATGVPGGSFRVRASACGSTLPPSAPSVSGSIPIAVAGRSGRGRGTQDIELVRGLSTVLPHEAVSSPMTHESYLRSLVQESDAELQSAGSSGRVEPFASGASLRSPSPLSTIPSERDVLAMLGGSSGKLQDCVKLPQHDALSHASTAATRSGWPSLPSSSSEQATGEQVHSSRRNGLTHHVAETTCDADGHAKPVDGHTSTCQPRSRTVTLVDWHLGTLLLLAAASGALCTLTVLQHRPQ